MSDYCTDILIHIDENLDDANIHEIERDISMIDGVYSACVHENARHLMLVDYDPENLVAQELLGQVENHGLHGSLVGL
ncbi:heavy-metal-associated domain-containing protein [Thiolapillus sp.]